MKLGSTEVGLRPAHIVLDGDPAPPIVRGTVGPTFWPMSIVAKRSPISATAELLFYKLQFLVVSVFIVSWWFFSHGCAHSKGM